MHRMRPLVVTAGTCLALALVFGPASRADLIRPDAGRSFPDIAADINGTMTYTYDPATQTGHYHVTNTPYLLALGPTLADESNITPTSTGVRSQVVDLTVDSSGHLVNSASNSYSLYGEVTVGQQVYSGLLLKGTPTSFGSQDLGVLGIRGEDIFDLNLKITGGLLAQAYGPDAYMRISPEVESTFNGSFTTNFSGDKAQSNTRAYNSPNPKAVPEPSALVVLLACGSAGLLYRTRRRIPWQELEGRESASRGAGE